uniref:Uncharacterized protein n=1 Tax=Phenylobacterium glaciei TaxID=2803784 RepID=A0A974S9Z2_9CAUL|nr:hypothetical protein JKL49_08840 [Phenylobacterium glaciei]
MLSRDEVDRIIAAASAKDGAQGLRIGCVVELIYASGLRISNSPPCRWRPWPATPPI